MSLFGSAARSSNKNIVQFRAGKMNLKVNFLWLINFRFRLYRFSLLLLASINSKTIEDLSIGISYPSVNGKATFGFYLD